MSIYQPSKMQPNGNALDFSSNQNFTSQVNGSIIKYYQDIVRRIDNNAILYDSTKTLLNPVKYDKEILVKTITNGTISYKGSVKWTRTIWDDLDNFAMSREYQFYSASTPTVNLSVSSPITQKSNTFLTTYNHPENISIKSYQYFLYDSTGLNQIDTSGIIYSQNLQYTYSNFVDGISYKIKCVVENAYGQISDTGLILFNVDYQQPSLSIIPSVSLLKELSAIKIEWSQPIYVTGSVIGSSNYVNGLFTPTNTGLKLNNSSYVEFNSLVIPQEFSARVDYIPDITFTSGVMVELLNSDGDIYQVGYDGTRFYFINNGIVVNGNLLALPMQVFLIAIRGIDVLIIQNNEILDWIYYTA